MLFQKNIRGFTLVEIAVSVVIIGMVAALLLPALRTFRERGKTTACLANLRHVYGALAVYAAENQAFVPSGVFADPTGGFSASGVDLPLVLDQYGVLEASFRCPLDTPDSHLGFYEPGYGSSYCYSGMPGQRLGETIYDDDHACTAEHIPVLTEAFVHWRGTANVLFQDGHVDSRKF